MNYSLKLTVLLCFCSMLFATDITSQNCESPCPELISNGDFENWQSDPGFSFWDGFAAISKNLVPNWSNIGELSTPDHLKPNSFPVLSPFLTSSTSSMCYYGAPSHSENLVQSVSIDSDPRLTYSLNFNYATVCMTGYTNPTNAEIFPIQNGNLEISTDNALQTTINLNSSHSVQTGFTNACLNLTNDNIYNSLVFTTNAIDPDIENEACFVLIDDVSMMCDLDDPNLYIRESMDGNITIFSLASADNQLPNVVSYNWVFSDGSTQSTPNAVVTDIDDDLTVCLDFVDDRGCCGNICGVVDLYIKDGDSDTGTEGSGVTEPWASPDIWVRNDPDGFDNQTTQSLCFKENLDNPDGTIRPVYIYVRVRNRGTADSPAGIGNLELYWTQPHAASHYLAWDGEIVSSVCDIAIGGRVSLEDIPLRSLDAGETTIYEIKWSSVPNPEDFEPCFGDNDSRHFCINARIVDDSTPLNLSNYFWADVQHFNDMALHNVTVLADGDTDWRDEEEQVDCNDYEWIVGSDPNTPNTGGTPPDPTIILVDPADPTTTVTVGDCILYGNPSDDTWEEVTLEIRFPSYRDWFYLKNTHIEMIPMTWSQYASDGNYQVETNRVNWNYAEQSFSWDLTSVDILTDPAYVTDLVFTPGEMDRICLELSGPLPLPDGNQDPIMFDIVQRNGEELIGGERYRLYLPTSEDQAVEGRSNKVNKIDSSSEIYPNPTNGIFTVRPSSTDESFDLMITNSIGANVYERKSFNSNLEVDTKDFGKGIFLVTIKNSVTGIFETKKLIVEE